MGGGGVGIVGGLENCPNINSREGGGGGWNSSGGWKIFQILITGGGRFSKTLN